MVGFLLGIVGNLVASALVTLPALWWHHRSMVRHVRAARLNSDIVAGRAGS